MSGVAAKQSNNADDVPRSLFDEDQHDALMERLNGSNVNAETLLTTDYLNHFSAMLMLLEMLPTDPPTFAGDILAWEPKTYAEHLRESGFRESKLAIICYEHADKDTRIAFDKIVSQLDSHTNFIIDRLNLSLSNENTEEVQQICEDAIPQMKQLIEQAASIVNGDKELIAGLSATQQQEDHQTASQAKIDALFD